MAYTALESKNLIDPDGPLSADLFNESEDKFEARVQSYVNQAKAYAAAIPSTETIGQNDKMACERSRALYLAYERLVTVKLAEPAQEGQPEYSRSTSNEQIRQLSQKRDAYEANAGALLAKYDTNLSGDGSSELVRV